jgi:hypothetical protein
MSPDDDHLWSTHLVYNKKQKQNGFSDVSLCDGLCYDLKIIARNWRDLKQNATCQNDHMNTGTSEFCKMSHFLNTGLLLNQNPLLFDNWDA